MSSWGARCASAARRLHAAGHAGRRSCRARAGCAWRDPRQPRVSIRDTRAHVEVRHIGAPGFDSAGPAPPRGSSLRAHLGWSTKATCAPRRAAGGPTQCNLRSGRLGHTRTDVRWRNGAGRRIRSRSPVGGQCIDGSPENRHIPPHRIWTPATSAASLDERGPQLLTRSDRRLLAQTPSGSLPTPIVGPEPRPPSADARARGDARDRGRIPGSNRAAGARMEMSFGT